MDATEHRHNRHTLLAPAARALVALTAAAVRAALAEHAPRAAVDGVVARGVAVPGGDVFRALPSCTTGEATRTP